MKMTIALFPVFMFLCVLTLGTFCVNYDLNILFHHTIPAFWALLLNIVTGGMSITLAIILKVLVLLGVIHG